MMLKKPLVAGLLAGALVLPLLQGCFTVVAAGVTTGALATFDRRSYGIQTDDEGIEWKASTQINEKLGDKAHINFTSYNRRALLTGEVGNARDKELAESIVKQVDNVAIVHNELDVANSPTFTEKAEDTLLTGKVKAGLIDTKQISANAFKVVNERGTVFLMGRVTQREADIATQVARTTKGVQRVVRLLEIISEEELARIAPKS